MGLSTVNSYMGWALESLIMCSRPRRAEGWKPAPESPLNSANLLSRFYFTWASPLVSRAAATAVPVQLEDLYYPPSDQKCNSAENEVEAAWQDEQKRAAAAGKRPSLTKAMWRCVRRSIAITFLYKMGWLIFAMISNSILLQELVSYLKPSSTRPDWYGYALAVAFLVVECARSVSVNAHWFHAVSSGVRLRAAARAMIFSKAMKLRGGGSGLATVGAATNLINNDAQRLLEACSYGEFLISTPVTVIVTLGIMWSVLGPSALAGFAVLLFFTPVQARMGKQFGRLRARTIRITDERSKLMSEVLTGIKLLKMYAWEAAFAERVADVRKREIAQLTETALVRTFNTVMAFSVPVLVTLATFTVFSFWTGEPLDPAAAYVCVSLFNVARFPLGILNLASKNVSEAVVAAGRIQQFLSLPEVQEDDLPVKVAPESDNDHKGADEKAAGEAQKLQQLTGSSASLGADVLLEARHATFTWPKEPASAQTASGKDGKGQSKAKGNLETPSPTPTTNSSSAPASPASASSSSDVTSGGVPSTPAIADVSFSLARGQVLAVVGPVASGKSSLLSSVLGQLKRNGGAFILPRSASVAYAAQSPWVFSGSLRENILFGAAFEQEWYDTVVNACCLRPDLAVLPDGDATEIGEKGLNLSGGQKARVALARAVYSRADLYLLDDPLSAVDVHVGRKLFNDVIGPRGLLAGRGKAVLLVTHQTQYLPQCSHVLVMDGGAVKHSGTYEQLVTSGVDLMLAAGTAATTTAGKPDADVDDVIADPTPKPAPAADGAAKTAASESAAEPAAASEETSDKASNVDSKPASGAPSDVTTASTSSLPASTTATDVNGSSSSSSTTVPGATNTEKPTAAAPSTGSSKGKLIAAEDRSVGRLAGSTVAAYFVSAGGVYIGLLLLTILIMSKGVRQVSDWWLSWWTQHRGQEPESWFLGMYAVTVAGVLIMTLVQGVAFAIVTLRASRHLHDRTFVSIMRAAPAWFDTQPTGRILARFTGDLDQIDTALPSSLEQASEYLIQCFLAIVLIIAVFPWFAIAVLPIIAAFYAIAKIFRRAARELKRLDSISRSPLVSHVAATMSGLVTIRSFGALDRYKDTARRVVDDSTRAYFAFYISNRWVAIRLDFATAVVAFVAALLCAINRRTLPPGLAGLVLTNSLQLAGILQFATRLLSECEAQLTSVERLNYYSNETAVPREHLAVVPVEPLDAPSKQPDAAMAAAEAGEGEDAGVQLKGVDDPRACNALLPDALLKQLLSAAPEDRDNGSSNKKAPSVAVGKKGAAGRFYAGWYRQSWHPGLLAAHWPSRGRIVFDNLSLRYRPGLPLVLKGVSFTIEPGQRCGLVGRTGSGKSTLLLGLLRYLEAAGGRVTIDGIDVSRVNVYHLRSSCAVIPQDPYLYEGTLRSNVDPFSSASDEEVTHALKQAGVAELASAHDKGLARPIAAGGGNLSVGERQLVCLARALLRDAPIIALDEATASTDASTDAAIQATIRTSPAMAGKTVLTIAHRLHTVMDYDRVLVLDKGCVVEYDSPAALLGLLAPSAVTSSGGASGGVTGPRGHFASMVDETGPETAAALREMAWAAAAARAAL